jgi:S-adenosylmethionine:tRNA ribosyltransferase-isomerase
VNVSDFDFELPPELIAQEPAAERGHARLLQLTRASGAVAHSQISALPGLLRPGDLLVVNDTRVFPARLLGRRVPSGGAVECLLIARLPSRNSPGFAAGLAPASTEQYWEALMHPGQKLKPGARVLCDGPCPLNVEVLERGFFGRRTIRLWTADGSSVGEAVDAIGHVPLPPYIKRPDRPEDRARYQTIFAEHRGSVAAPTAGLHFTAPLVAALGDRGVEIARITLHVGYGTFQPVRVEQLEEHRLEPERFEIEQSAADAINTALAEKRRIIAVGTTTTRTLEAVALAHDGRVAAGSGVTDLFVFPGFRFRVIGGLLTNFHLPRSSLVMLTCAFGGFEQVMAAYRSAIAERYRFYSYGDAMLIL